MYFTFFKIQFFQYWFSLRFVNQYFLKTSTCLEKNTWICACIFQVDHKSSLEWFLPRVIWIYSQTSFRCITQWWKSSSWAHPLEQCTWCILSSKPHMIPTMTRSGKIKYFVKWTLQLLLVKTLLSQKFCQNLILGFSHLRIEFLLGPCALLALVLNHEFSVMEILWTFSIYLESVAILPQLFMVQKTGEAESITSHYLFALG